MPGSKEDIKSILMKKLEKMPVIDTHEHFCPEKKHYGLKFNFFSLFQPYIQHDLKCAGMPVEWMQRPPVTEEELEQCWKDIRDIWKYVRHGSYARVMRMALKEFYGFQDINDDNYKEIGKLLNENNKPGLYERVLFDKCNIKYIINQHFDYSFEEPYMKGAIQMTLLYGMPAKMKEFIEAAKKHVKLSDYVEYVRNDVETAKKQGALLIKFDVSSFIHPVDISKAEDEFQRLVNGDNIFRTTHVEPYICDLALQWAAEYDMVAAVHTGVWGDIREKNPEILFPIIYKYPQVTFDIYHAGMPYVRECGFLGKNAENTYLNLCWSYIVSPEMTRSAVNEWLDFVPANKIFAFGGDFFSNPENIWAHLQIAKDCLADIFADRIVKGTIDIDGAEEVLRMWFYDNPARVYKLD